MCTKIGFLLSTWFYTGYSKKAPGTVGSLCALPFAYLTIRYFGTLGLIFGAIILFLIGLWAAKIVIETTGTKDPQIVVIDEVVGIFITLIPANLIWWHFLAAFLLFRLFDITKPYPVSWADKQVKGALGVMLDDVLAGIYGAICIYLLVLL